MYPDGLMIICTSIPRTQYEDRYYGEEFLLKYSVGGIRQSRPRSGF